MNLPARRLPTPAAPSQRMGAVSHVGRRETNEDSYVIYDLALTRTPDQPIAVLAVADGMGGHSYGALAARTALSPADRLLDGDRSPDALRQLLGLANQLVLHQGRAVGASIGTTVTLAVVEPNLARVAHVGDSRAYLIHGGGITQITEDHSLVGELLRQGAISEEEARMHRQRNVLKRAVGVEVELEVDVYEVGLGSGDSLLLCTDGLATMVRPEEMLAALEGSPSMEEAAARLVTLAYERGGDDNITVLVWTYPGGPETLHKTLSDLDRTGAEPAFRGLSALRAAMVAAAGVLGLVLGWIVGRSI